MAIGSFGARVGKSSAKVQVDASGRYTLFVGVTDIGTGARTAMALIAAEALEIPLAQLTVVHGDTGTCPYSVGESGSRTTGFTGTAVYDACRELKQRMASAGLPHGQDVLVAEVTSTPKIEKAARYSFAAHFVEVEVDVEYGRVRVTRYRAVHDSGRIVNPVAATSQIKGGVTLGIGMALREELLYDPSSGVPLNAGYYGARVVTHADAPEVEVEFVETEDAYGPYGAKAVGEPPIVPSVAAIANALFNATGVRFTDLPITRDRILGGRA
jgi:xanthine dehydrogenase YagR molybdenum-binding subunit